MEQNQQNATLAANLDSDLYTGIFGNMNYSVQPSMTGEVSNTFGTLPYVSLESIIDATTRNAQVDPGNILGGQTSGQQNIQGSYTIQDGNGLTRMVMGYSPGGF